MEMKLMQLPQNVQNEVKDTLKAFNKVNVVYQHGKYNVTASTCLRATYAEDYKFCGVYKKEQVFTQDEMICNYIEQFHSYPSNYEGRRDWAMIKDLQELRQRDYYGIIELDESGNAYIASIVENEE